MLATGGVELKPAQEGKGSEGGRVEVRRLHFSEGLRMGCGQLTPVGALCCDSFSSRVTERLSVRGLGLNSSPGQPSRKCVSFLTRQSRGAGERVCRSVEIHLHRWKNNSKFMTRWR